MSHPNQPLAPSRWRRRLYEAGAALALLAVIALGVVGQCWHTTRQDVADAVAEADRLDPDWRFEELEAQRQLPPPEQNSACGQSPSMLQSWLTGLNSIPPV